jgi:organic radical activating enzyme
MNDATPGGEHMTDEVFEATMDFLDRVNSPLWLITGGEPTMHPKFLPLMAAANSRAGVQRVKIISNGHFLFDDDYTQQIMSLGNPIQVTYDKRYYPIRIDADKAKSYPLIEFTDTVQRIYPQGRAVDSHLPPNAIGPKCYNVRSIARRNTTNLTETILLLRVMGKFCSPSINADGSISAGESRLCHKIGSVFDNPATVFKNLQEMSCDKCGLLGNLALSYRKVLE